MKNYLDRFRDTEMYKNQMIGLEDINQQLDEPKCTTTMHEREDIKILARKIIEAGFLDFGLRMIDFSHRQRYLTGGKEKVMTFYEYVEYKYTNPELQTG